MKKVLTEKTAALLSISILAITLSIVGTAANSCSTTTTSWAPIAEGIAAVVVNGAEAAVAVADPKDSPIVNQIGAAFNGVLSALQTYQKNPSGTALGNVAAALQQASANAAQFEVAVKNPNTQREIAALAPIISQAISEIAALMPVSTNPTLNAMSIRAKHLKAKDFKRQINDNFKGTPGWHKI